MPYLEDSFLLGATQEECKYAVQSTAMTLKDLGFIIHTEKSRFLPSQTIEFLGFVLNSVAMTVSLPHEKILKIREACNALSRKRGVTIQQVAHVIGLLVSSFPGVAYGPLHYRELEREKTAALQASGGNYMAGMTVTEPMREELGWWVTRFYLCRTALPRTQARPGNSKRP